MKEKENFKKIRGLADEFAKRKDSLLAIYACGDKNGGFSFTGDPDKIGQGVYHLLKKGLSDEADEEETTMVDALLFGFYLLANDCCIESVALFDALAKIFDADEDEEDGDGIKDFDPSDEVCKSCGDFENCLSKMVGSLGYEIRKKQETKKKK